MKALVIVDMQDYFFEQAPMDLNVRIVEQVRFYKGNAWPIIVLEYRTNPYDPDDDRCGRTNDTILAELKDYDHLAVFGKDKDDGSKWLKHYIDDNLSRVDELELVGVNLDCCVMATASGLARNHCEKLITINEECCDSHSHQAACMGYDETVEDTLERVVNSPSDNLRMLIEQRG